MGDLVSETTVSVDAIEEVLDLASAHPLTGDSAPRVSALGGGAEVFVMPPFHGRILAPYVKVTFLQRFPWAGTDRCGG